MSKRQLGIIAAVALGLLTPKLAQAQEWLKDRQANQGAGIQAGDNLELHPSIGAEVGYDSNYFLRSTKDGPNIINAAPTNPVEGTGMLRVTPALSISTVRPLVGGSDVTQEPPKVTFTGGLSATYREFLFNSDLTSQRNISAQADAAAQILPGRPVGLILNGGFSRVIQPTVLGDPNLSFNRDDVTAAAALVLQPGSGTLDWRFGYQFLGSYFEDQTGATLNNVTHEVLTKGRWKWRPRTALIYDATMRFINYADATNVTGLRNSTPVRARLGLTGLVSSNLSLLALAGYGASFFDTTGSATVQQYDSVIGQVEAKYYLTAPPGGDPAAMSLTLSSVAIGYLRDFENSYLGDFYGTDKVYAKISWFFAGRVQLSLTGSVSTIEYPTLFNLDNSVNHAAFTDVRADTTLFGEYRLTSNFGINATVGYAQNFSSTQLTTPPPAGAPPGTPPTVYDMSWQRVQAFLGVRWFM